MEQLKSESSAVTKRPTGVWLLTIYAAIFAGLAPLVLATVLFISGNLGIEPVFLFTSMFLNASIIYYSVRTWQGNDRSRKIFLILITAHYVIIALNNLSMLLSEQIPGDDQATYLGRIFRGVIYPTLFIWYFNRSKTKDFYETKKTTFRFDTP